MCVKKVTILCLLSVVFNNLQASPIKTVPINKNDLVSARSIHNLHKQLKKISLKKKTLRRGYTHIKKSKTFGIYRELFKKLNLITQKKIATNSLIKICNEISRIKKNKERPIFNDTLELSNHFCIGKYLKSKARRKIRFLSSLEKDFLKKNLSPLLAGKHKRTFIVFLDKIKDDSLAQVFISKAITSFYINLNESPDKKIISHIIIDEQLTSYIQIKELIDHSTLNFFKKEFRILYKKSLNNIIKDKKESKIEESINYIVSFYDTNKNYLSSEKAMTYFKSLLKNLLSKKIFKIANKFSQIIVDSMPPQLENEAVFLRMWTLLRIGHIQDTLAIVKKKQLVKIFGTLDSRLRYWTAITFKRNDEWEQAKELFHKQIRLNPINYYSILSFKELQKLSKNINARDLFMFNNFSLSKMQEHQDEVYKRLISRLEIWIKIHNNNFIMSEIETFLESERERFKDVRHIASTSKNDNKNLTFKLISYLNKKKKYLTIFSIINDSIEQNIIHINEQILNFLFPTQYMTAIKNIDNIIDPLVVLSLIRQESAFNPRARSIVGAQGLMQLMPQTARRFNTKIRPHHLKKPKLNIRIGTKLLRKLLKKYDGNLIYALAAYNAGERNANKWIRNRFTGTEAEDIIEEIPFRETRLYVKLIYRNLFFYNMLFGKDDFIKLKKSKTFYSHKY